MGLTLRPVDYFHGTVASDAAEACRWLSDIADAGVNLLAFCAVPAGAGRTQLTLFPDSTERFLDAVKGGAVEWTGPQKAILVQGDDHLGAAAHIYGLLAGAGVEVYSSTGVTDGRGGFGYVLYVRPGDFSRAVGALAEASSEAQ
ncbi:MAG: hypothetical protein GC160_21340 [Acidobacteria bacterium]|nr:hypothetical protein [Acidobacteriota bacterium]